MFPVSLSAKPNSAAHKLSDGKGDAPCHGNLLPSTATWAREWEVCAPAIADGTADAEWEAREAALRAATAKQWRAIAHKAVTKPRKVSSRKSKAVTRLQAVVRGWLARKILHSVKRARALESRAAHRAAKRDAKRGKRAAKRAAQRAAKLKSSTVNPQSNRAMLIRVRGGGVNDPMPAAPVSGPTGSPHLPTRGPQETPGLRSLRPRAHKRTSMTAVSSSPNAVSSSPVETLNCVICMQPLDPVQGISRGDSVWGRTPCCKHAYHRRCLQKHLNCATDETAAEEIAARKTCPTCRSWPLNVRSLIINNGSGGSSGPSSSSGGPSSVRVHDASSAMHNAERSAALNIGPDQETEQATEQSSATKPSPPPSESASKRPRVESSHPGIATSTTDPVGEQAGDLANDGAPADADQQMVEARAHAEAEASPSYRTLRWPWQRRKWRRLTRRPSRQQQI